MQDCPAWWCTNCNTIACYFSWIQIQYRKNRYFCLTEIFTSHRFCVTLCTWSTKQTIPLTVLARNQTKAWARDLDATGSWKGTPERIGQRDLEKAVGEGWREWPVDTGHLRDLSDEIGSSRSEGRPVKMSQHSSWVVEFSQKIHVSVTLHMHKGMQCYITPLLTLWVNPSSYCSFVLCSFLPLPWLYFL